MKNAKLYEFVFMGGGVLVLLLWLLVFNIGLIVDSEFYRVAINYGFADFHDWFWTVLSFTISNVTILAFLSGLLGGITSKTLATQSFTLTEVELKEKFKGSSLIENPFISGFRGVFVFLAILSFQYLSSITDIGSIKVNVSEIEAKEEKRDSAVYYAIVNAVDDSTSKAKIRKVLKDESSKIKKEEDTDSLVSWCILIKGNLKYLNEKPASNFKEGDGILKQNLEQSLLKIRSKLKLPPDADIAGISSVSYFHFAVLMSFLSFIFGYDPSLFKSFISKIPFTTNNKKDEEESKVEKS
jgi:hypothetical protein